jgi:hypothetical protein
MRGILGVMQLSAAAEGNEVPERVGQCRVEELEGAVGDSPGWIE